MRRDFDERYCIVGILPEDLRADGGGFRSDCRKKAQRG
jgi:hypothetical protein